MSDTFYQDQVLAAGPWNCSDKTLLKEFHRARELAKYMAERADHHRAEIEKLRKLRADYKAALHGAGACDD